MCLLALSTTIFSAQYLLVGGGSTNKLGVDDTWCCDADDSGSCNSTEVATWSHSESDFPICNGIFSGTPCDYLGRPIAASDCGINGIQPQTPVNGSTTGRAVVSQGLYINNLLNGKTAKAVYLENASLVANGLTVTGHTYGGIPYGIPVANSLPVSITLSTSDINGVIGAPGGWDFPLTISITDSSVWTVYLGQGSSLTATGTTFDSEFPVSATSFSGMNGAIGLLEGASSVNIDNSEIQGMIFSLSPSDCPDLAHVNITNSDFTNDGSIFAGVLEGKLENVDFYNLNYDISDQYSSIVLFRSNYNLTNVGIDSQTGSGTPVTGFGGRVVLIDTNLNAENLDITGRNELSGIVHMVGTLNITNSEFALDYSGHEGYHIVSGGEDSGIFPSGTGLCDAEPLANSETIVNVLNSNFTADDVKETIGIALVDDVIGDIRGNRFYSSDETLNYSGVHQIHDSGVISPGSLIVSENDFIDLKEGVTVNQDVISNSSIYGNRLENLFYGIAIASSAFSEVYGNNMTIRDVNNSNGILIFFSPDSQIYNNNITCMGSEADTFGITLNQIMGTSIHDNYIEGFDRGLYGLSSASGIANISSNLFLDNIEFHMAAVYMDVVADNNTFLSTNPLNMTDKGLVFSEGNFNITRNIIDGIADTAVVMMSAGDFYVANNNVTNAMHGINGYQPDSLHAEFNRVINSTFGMSYYGKSSVTNATFNGNYVRNSTTFGVILLDLPFGNFSNNNISENYGAAVEIQTSENITGSSNYMDEVLGYGFYIKESSGIDFANSTISGVSLAGPPPDLGGTGIAIEECDNVSLRDSPDSVHHLETGIIIFNSTNVLIHNVSIHDISSTTVPYSDDNYSTHFQGGGVIATDSDNLTISSCNISNNNGTGILAISSSSPRSCSAVETTELPAITIIDNALDNNGLSPGSSGIELMYYSPEIARNRITGSPFFGLFSWGHGSLNISQNTISSNIFPVVLVEDSLVLPPEPVNYTDHHFISNDVTADQIGMVLRYAQRCDWNWSYYCFTNVSGNDFDSLGGSLISTGCVFGNETNTFLNPTSMLFDTAQGWISQVLTVDPEGSPVPANVTVQIQDISSHYPFDDANGTYDYADVDFTSLFGMVENISKFETDDTGLTRRFIVYEEIVNQSGTNATRYTPHLFQGVREVELSSGVYKNYTGYLWVPYDFNRPVTLPIPNCPIGPAPGTDSVLIYGGDDSFLYNGTGWNSVDAPAGTKGFTGASSYGDISVVSDLNSVQVYNANTGAWTRIVDNKGIVDVLTSQRLVVVEGGSSVKVYDSQDSSISSLSSGGYKRSDAVSATNSIAVVEDYSLGKIKRVSVYDADDSSWEYKTAVSFGATSLSVISVSGGLVALEARNTAGETKAVSVYDAADNSWDTKTAASFGASSLEVISASPSMVAIEAVDSSGDTKAISIYDANTDAWETKTAASVGAASIEVLSGSSTFIAAGAKEGGGDIKSVLIYDVSSTSWSDKTRASLGVAKLQVVSASTQLVAVAGVEATDEVSRISIYSPAIPGWDDSLTATGLGVDELRVVGYAPTLVAVEGIDSGVSERVSVFDSEQSDWDNSLTATSKGVDRLHVSAASFYLLAVEGNESGAIEEVYVYDSQLAGWGTDLNAPPGEEVRVRGVSEFLVAVDGPGDANVNVYDIQDSSWHEKSSSTSISSAAMCTLMLGALEENIAGTLNTTMHVFVSGEGWETETATDHEGLIFPLASVDLVSVQGAGTTQQVSDNIQVYDRTTSSFEPRIVNPERAVYTQLSPKFATAYTIDDTEMDSAFVYPVGGSWTFQSIGNIEEGVVCPWQDCARCQSDAECPEDLPECNEDGVCVAVCGDGICGPLENPSNCAADCHCGNGICEIALGETAVTCPADCDCGDGICDSTENCSTCPSDCGPCAFCGDGICDSTEDCNTCPEDCGPCAFCGDGICNGAEWCGNCPQDCGACDTSRPRLRLSVSYSCLDWPVYLSIGATGSPKADIYVMLDGQTIETFRNVREDEQVEFQPPKTGTYEARASAPGFKDPDPEIFDINECETPECVCPDGICVDDICYPCPEDLECEYEMCIEGQCIICNSGAECPENYTCEDGECVEIQPPPECEVDDDCAYYEKCQLGECIVVPCDCGEYIDHSCSLYECCSDAMCDAGYECIEHECVKKQEPEPPEQEPEPEPEPEPQMDIVSAETCLCLSLALIMLALIFFYWRKKKKGEEEELEGEGPPLPSREELSTQYGQAKAEQQALSQGGIEGLKQSASGMLGSLKEGLGKAIPKEEKKPKGKGKSYE